MKVILIDVPYGKVLRLPTSAAASLAEAAIVDRKSYDWNDLTECKEQVELRIVDADTIKPLPEPPIVAPETTAVIPAPEVPEIITSDIPF